VRGYEDDVLPRVNALISRYTRFIQAREAEAREAEEAQAHDAKAREAQAHEAKAREAQAREAKAAKAAEAAKAAKAAEVAKAANVREAPPSTGHDDHKHKRFRPICELTIAGIELTSEKMEALEPGLNVGQDLFDAMLTVQLSSPSATPLSCCVLSTYQFRTLRGAVLQATNLFREDDLGSGAVAEAKLHESFTRLGRRWGLIETVTDKDDGYGPLAHTMLQARDTNLVAIVITGLGHYSLAAFFPSNERREVLHMDSFETSTHGELVCTNVLPFIQCLFNLMEAPTYKRVPVDFQPVMGPNKNLCAFSSLLFVQLAMKMLERLERGDEKVSDQHWTKVNALFAGYVSKRTTVQAYIDKRAAMAATIKEMGCSHISCL